jgi:RimJ/RimL family protein N-acetyltransferase
MIDFNHGVMLDTIDKAENARLWRNLKEHNQYFRQSGLISVYQQEQWREKIQTDPSMRMFAIVRPPNYTEACGVCGLTGIDWIHSKAELSCYVIGWSYARTKAAFKTLVDHAFKDLNIHRLWTETFETHELHLRILKEIGFTEEGILRQSYFKDGKYINSIIHSLINL